MGKLTAEQMAAADAEWDALPGAEPDGWSFIPEAELGTYPAGVIKRRVDAWAPEMTYARATAVGLPESHPAMARGVWLAVWKARPAKEAEFNPPVTLQPQENPHAG